MAGFYFSESARDAADDSEEVAPEIDWSGFDWYQLQTRDESGLWVPAIRGTLNQTRLSDDVASEFETIQEARAIGIELGLIGEFRIVATETGAAVEWWSNDYDDDDDDDDDDDEN
jgi:hypothetical protein